MADLTEIREGIAANLQAATGVQASAYMLSSPTPPYIEVVPGEIEYDLAFQRGYDTWALKVRVLVGAASDIGSQKQLDPFLAPTGAKSIKALIEANSTLGGDVEDLRVTKCSGYRLYARDGGAPALGAEWDVIVWADGRS